MPAAWSQSTLVRQSRIAKTIAICIYFFFQLPFRIDIYACKSSNVQEEETVEFGKGEKERKRERESLQSHIIINSTCANLIGSVGVRLTTKSAQVSRRKNPQAVFEESHQYPCDFNSNNNMVCKLASTLIVSKSCHQTQVGGEIDFKEPWLIECRGVTLGHYFIYNSRGAVSAHSLIVINTLESKKKTQKSLLLLLFPPIRHFLVFSRHRPLLLFFPSLYSSPPTPLDMQQTTRIHACLFLFQLKKEKKERRMHKRRIEKNGNPHASAQTVLPAMRP